MEIHDDVEAVKLSEEFRDAFIQGLALSIPITIGILVFCWVMSSTYRTASDNSMMSVAAATQAMDQMNKHLKDVSGQIESNRLATVLSFTAFSKFLEDQSEKIIHSSEALLSETQKELSLLREELEGVTMSREDYLLKKVERIEGRIKQLEGK